MTDALSQSDRSLTISTPAGDDTFVAVSLMGREAISRPFEFTVDLISEKTSVDLTKIVGKPASVLVKMPDDVQRYFHGIVWRFTEGAVAEIEGAPLRYYQAELGPWTNFLKLNSDCRIFQNLAAPDIIEQILKDRGFTDYKKSLSATYAKLDYCVQYNETDYDFICRLLERFGIYYYFTHEEQKHTLVLGDAATGYVKCDQDSVDYFEDGGGDPTGGRITAWNHRYECIPGKFSLIDYNYETPDTALTATEKSIVKIAATSELERYEYPGGFQKSADGKAVALVRIEQQESLYSIVSGKGNCAAFQVGSKFKVASHPVSEEENVDYALTFVKHEVREPVLFASGALIGGSSEESTFYRNQFECVPAKVVVRPPRVTQKPIIQGPQSAVVVGPESKELFTNKFGEVKVQFHWDRQGQMDEKSSCWVRVAQGWAGGQYGGQFMPRVGHEVIVEYLDGDIDRPIITGCVYNGSQMPPYALPDEQNKSGLKTYSLEKGDSTKYNELRFDDTLGKEEIYFHAERNFQRVVENDDILKVGFDSKDQGDQTIDIYNNRTVTIDQGNELFTVKTGDRTISVDQGNQALTVKTGNRTVSVDKGNDSLTVGQGNRTVTVSQGNHELTVSSGNHTISVSGGASTISAGKSITLKVGSNSITIDTSGITIKGTMVSIQGSAQAEFKSPMTTVSGDGTMTVKGGIVQIN